MNAASDERNYHGEECYGNGRGGFFSIGWNRVDSFDLPPAMKRTSIKICYIGGGSRYWAKMVMTDLALTPELEGEIALFDIDHAAAKRNEREAADLFRHPDARTSFKVKAYRDRRVALRGADFVFMSILPGAMQMMSADLDIPAKYGILQTVGDTTGPGGISRALRALPIYREYAHLIMQICPRAWVINYTNPMTLCTAALFEAEPRIKAFGCCHEVFGTQRKLAEIVATDAGGEVPDRREIVLDISGVNHFTFATSARYQGQDLFPVVDRYLENPTVWADHSRWARLQKRQGKFFESRNMVAWDFYKRFGALGAAGDRHLVEFVPWYLSSEKNLHRVGVVVTPSSYRLGKWKPPGNAPHRSQRVEHDHWVNGAGLSRSGEEAVEQLLALLGLRDLDTNINLPNRGQVPGVPLGAVVETNARLRRDAVEPIVACPLPSALLPLVNQVVATQLLTLEASRRADKGLAFQALLSDPLVTIPVSEAEKMFDELLRANCAELPAAFVN